LEAEEIDIELDDVSGIDAELSDESTVLIGRDDVCMELVNEVEELVTVDRIAVDVANVDADGLSPTLAIEDEESIMSDCEEEAETAKCVDTKDGVEDSEMVADVPPLSPVLVECEGDPEPSPWPIDDTTTTLDDDRVEEPSCTGRTLFEVARYAWAVEYPRSLCSDTNPDCRVYASCW
jgi:hypothetical protein